MGVHSVVIVAASRPHPGETVNGDDWTVSWHDQTCRIAVIDGLGHGPEAAAAARAAVEALATHPQLGPSEALRVCHEVLHGTRGAAIAIALINPQAAQLTYAGVGNIEARLWKPSGWQRPITYRGIVGAALPTPRSFAFALEPGWLLLLHTDGVSARFDDDILPEDPRREPQAFADAVLSRWGRHTDDATVVVAGPPGAGRRRTERRRQPPVE